MITSSFFNSLRENNMKGYRLITYITTFKMPLFVINAL